MNERFRIEPLTAKHDRKVFYCDVDVLNGYFYQQVSQDVRRRITACYVVIEVKTNRIAGYYTLAASSIALDDMPDVLAKRLPYYRAVPVARLGRLAIDNEFRGIGLGAALLWDAVMRSIRSEIAVFALVVDAKDEQAISFYRHHGFFEFGSLQNHLLLPLTNRLLQNFH